MALALKSGSPGPGVPSGLGVTRPPRGQHLGPSWQEHPVGWWGSILPWERLGDACPHRVNAQTFSGARGLPPAPAEAPRRVRAVQYLDPVHRVMNDGGLRLLQKEAQRKGGGR